MYYFIEERKINDFEFVNYYFIIFDTYNISFWISFHFDISTTKI